MDLHAWITQQVDHVEAGARDALNEDVFFDVTDERTAQHYQRGGSPEVALRRCEADRRILARHQLNPNFTHEPACHGCGTYGDMDLSNIDNLNDCPELLDLAHAHGITPDVLAGLDRPQPPEPKSWLDQAEDYLHVANLGRGTRPITTSDVPAALRGPRWKP
ncbi:hypothetical protein ACFY9G_23410 [Streptomyces anthocyanicus]|uniref:hypothetical protein n=1 Tax=Streptomyces anthocyanicus TaxID=68174 RepID=UPI0036EB7AF4